MYLKQVQKQMICTFSIKNYLSFKCNSVWKSQKDTMHLMGSIFLSQTLMEQIVYSRNVKGWILTYLIIFIFIARWPGAILLRATSSTAPAASRWAVTSTRTETLRTPASSLRTTARPTRTTSSTTSTSPSLTTPVPRKTGENSFSILAKLEDELSVSFRLVLSP